MLFGCYKIVFLILVAGCLGVHGKSTYKGWTNKEADVFFLLDSAQSIWIVDYSKLRAFVSQLVSGMDIGPSFTRVGVGVFSDYHRLYVSINNNFPKDELKRRIETAPYLKGDGYLSRALKGLREEGLPRGLVRQGVPLIAVLFTDGVSRYKQLTADNATLVKKEGIFLFTVGIGGLVERDELRLIASDPKSDFSYFVTDFDHLQDIREQLSSRMSEVEVFQGDEGTCGDKIKADTVFVFDETAIGEIDTQKIKNFTQAVVNGFSMNSGNIRVGVVSKTCHQEGDIMLGQYITKEDFFAGLNYKDGLDISELLKRVRLTSFLPENGARPDAKKRIVLILHAELAKKTEVLREANRAKYAGNEIFVIRLGTDYVKSFITSLASSVDHTMFPGSADDLLKPESIQTFTSSFCKDL